METYRLIPHPDTPPTHVADMSVRWLEGRGGETILRWRLDGAQGVVLPVYSGSGRADELWRTTCFELFLMEGRGPGYVEFNFAPSQRWAAYRFTSYRANGEPFEPPGAPAIACERGERILTFTATLPRLPHGVGAAALSAVIEEEGGALSYWALRHEPGPPDFHHPGCFVARDEAPEAP